jgi:hypothetical protein
MDPAVEVEPVTIENAIHRLKPQRLLVLQAPKPGESRLAPGRGTSPAQAMGCATLY